MEQQRFTRTLVASYYRSLNGNYRDYGDYLGCYLGIIGVILGGYIGVILGKYGDNGKIKWELL